MAAREIGPALQKLREVLLGRKHMNNLRFPPVMATRDWDSVPANLPPGPSHLLSANGYYTRDGRRDVHPPTVLADGAKVRLVIGLVKYYLCCLIRFWKVEMLFLLC